MDKHETGRGDHTHPAQRGWKRTVQEIIAPGVAGGVIAAVAMAVLAMLHSALAGRGLLWPFFRVAEGVLGQTAESLSAAAFGGLVHLVVASVWGVLFVALVPRGAPFAHALTMGLIFGTVVFLVMTWLVLPQVQQALLLAVPNLVLFAYHLVFGLLVALAVPIRRRLSTGHPLSEHPASRRVPL